MQLAQDPSVDQLNPRVPEWQKLGGVACFCLMNRLFLFGVQMTQDPSEDRFNLENSRAVVWKSSTGKMYLEVSRASAV